MTGHVSPSQRFSRRHPCPVCGGANTDGRRQGMRCYGFISDDGAWVHCTREEHAGALEMHPDSHTFAHRSSGACPCGGSHDGRPGLHPARMTVRHTEERSLEEQSRACRFDVAYDYRDEEGRLVHQTLRYSYPNKEKSFAQRQPRAPHPNPRRYGDWHWNLGGVRKVLYRLPQLLAADKALPVFLCEGEKDADRVTSLGLVATTAPLGAGSWEEHYTYWLRDRVMVLLEDNNDAGRRQVDRLSRELGGVARSITVVDFRASGDGADVSSWLDAGGTKELLLEMARQMPAPIDAGVGKMGRQIPIDAPSLLAKVLPPVRWAVNELLPEGLSLFVGKTKIGKSWAAYSLGIGIACGGRVFGKIPVEQGEVLYLALEDGERRLQTRLKRLMEGQPAPAGLYLVTEWPRVDEGGIEHLDAWLREHPATRFVIVDTLKRFRPVSGSQKSVYDADYESLQGLQAFATRHHVAVLVVHHMRKLPADDPLDAINGSTGLLAVADGVWMLQRERKTVEATLLVVHREGEDQELALTWNPSMVTWTLAGDAEELRRSKERQAIIDLLTEADEPMTPKEIAEALGKNYSTTRALLQKMLRAEEVQRMGGGRYVVNKERKPRKLVNSPGAVVPLFPHVQAKNGEWEEDQSGFTDTFGVVSNCPHVQAKDRPSDYAFTEFTHIDDDDDVMEI